MLNWKSLKTLGIISIIVGALALFYPLPASLAVEQFTGWMFLFLGVVQIFTAFGAKGYSAKLWTFFLGLIAVFVGINLLKEPLEGMVTLTLILGTLFVVSGLFKFIAGLQSKKSQLKTTFLVSGLVSLVLGVMIISSLSTSAGIVLGTLLGIELIFSGMSAIALSSLHKLSLSELS